MFAQGLDFTNKLFTTVKIFYLNKNEIYSNMTKYAANNLWAALPSIIFYLLVYTSVHIAYILYVYHRPEWICVHSFVRLFVFGVVGPLCSSLISFSWWCFWWINNKIIITWTNPHYSVSQEWWRQFGTCIFERNMCAQCALLYCD